MIYKTHKDVYKSVAGKLNIDFEVIRTIGDFYWKDISERIADFKHRDLYVNKLGMFRFRNLESKKYIQNSSNTRMLLEGLGKSEEIIQKSEEKIKDRTDKMKVLIDDWKFVMDEYKKHKIDVKGAYRNLQEQKQDMGGTEE